MSEPTVKRATEERGWLCTCGYTYTEMVRKGAGRMSEYARAQGFKHQLACRGRMVPVVDGVPS